TCGAGPRLTDSEPSHLSQVNSSAPLQIPWSLANNVPYRMASAETGHSTSSAGGSMLSASASLSIRRLGGVVIQANKV
ncbi:hypothetical protein OS493_039269, partial [Desmophyllum pertusum]